MYALSVSSCDKYNPHHNHGLFKFMFFEFVAIVVLFAAYSYHSFIYYYNSSSSAIITMHSTALYATFHPSIYILLFSPHLMIISLCVLFLIERFHASPYSMFEGI